MYMFMPMIMLRFHAWDFTVYSREETSLTNHDSRRTVNLFSKTEYSCTQSTGTTVQQLHIRKSPYLHSDMEMDLVMDMDKDTGLDTGKDMDTNTNKDQA
jgi:hypothetical protein